MTDRDLDRIESDLDVTLPLAFRGFMSSNAAELTKAREALCYQVVLLTSPDQVVALNRAIRKHGIEVGEDATPAPWPREYLAISDDGAGSHQCLRLDETNPGIYLFDGEAGRFEREFESVAAYLTDLRKRLRESTKTPARRSAKDLLERAPAFYRDSKGLVVTIQDIKPPLTADKLREEGVDLSRAIDELVRMLQAVTGITHDNWSIQLSDGDGPAQVRLGYSQPETSRPNIELSGCQMFEGQLRLSVRIPQQIDVFDATIVNWDEFHEGVRGLHEAFMRTRLQMTPSKLKIGTPTSARYVGIECKYVIAHA